MENKIEIYASGVCYCSVCADNMLAIKEIVNLVNIQNPTGISSRWGLSEENFREGKRNPHPCERHKGRSHYLFEC